MAQQGLQRSVQTQKKRPSLSVRISIGLVLAAVLPLILTIVFSELQSRPTLTTQAREAMTSDAQSRVQLINTYFNERLLDAQTLSQVPSLLTFMQATPSTSPTYRDLAVHATYALEAGRFRDKHYSTWALFDTKGKLLLSYPIMPQTHGQYLIPPEDLQQVDALKTFASAVYYNPSTQKASVDIYSPIGGLSNIPLLGFMRATLNLDYIWDIVKQDVGPANDGRDAFILDENGVRIADTQPSRLFTAVVPISPQVQQRITSEARYGTTNDVPLLSDALLAQHLHSTTDTIYQGQPTGQKEDFQIVQLAATTVPWTYYVLNSVNTVTLVANQQLFFTAFIALAIAILAAIFGIVFGRRISYPIMTSVESLQKSSYALNTLATKQQDAASEQMWVVDSSQVGLQSVQYYTDATRVAARQLNDINTELSQNWYQIDEKRARQHLERATTAAQYIENAAQYQGTSNQKLATALKVATQVTEQLAAGATSATDAATQLERVVEELRYVVGK